MNRRDFLSGLAALPLAAKAAMMQIMMEHPGKPELYHKLLSQRHKDLDGVLGARQARSGSIVTVAILDEDGDLWIDPAYTEIANA